MENKYSYLKQFCNKGLTDQKGPKNWFELVKISEITKAESLIGFEFPLSLKEFWLEVGYGSLKININLYNSDLNNYIIHPLDVANIILRKDESEDLDLPVLSDVLDMYLEEGDIPFMEVADSSDFLKMKRDSDGIYDCGGDLLEESFEKFIWRLYHESAKYYLFVGPNPAPKPE